MKSPGCLQQPDGRGIALVSAETGWKAARGEVSRYLWWIGVGLLLVFLLLLRLGSFFGLGLVLVPVLVPLQASDVKKPSFLLRRLC